MRYKGLFFSNLALAMITVGIAGQTSPSLSAQDKIEFEVASVKISGPRPSTPLPPDGRVEGGPGTSDPELIKWLRRPMKNLLVDAYGVTADQIVGPGWVTSDDPFNVPRYDVVAKVRIGTTQDQLRLMLQALLQERFKLVLHHASKEFPAYDLIAADRGTKFHESLEDDPNARSSSTLDTLAAEGLAGGPFQRYSAGEDGFPQISSGRKVLAMSPRRSDGHVRIRAVGQPLSALAEFLTGEAGLSTRVVDKTGLRGRYDFTLDYMAEVDLSRLSPESAALASSGEPTRGDDIDTALQKQLGLRLEKSKTSVDILVIDQIEKIPTAN